MSTIIRKLSSRKLWLAIAGVATGVALALGADASDIQTVAGAVTALVSAVTYIITEGRVDAASVTQAITGVEIIQDALAAVDEEGADGQ